SHSSLRVKIFNQNRIINDFCFDNKGLLLDGDISGPYHKEIESFFLRYYLTAERLKAIEGLSYDSPQKVIQSAYNNDTPFYVFLPYSEEGIRYNPRDSWEYADRPLIPARYIIDGDWFAGGF
ncbi:Hypothetical protein DPCES_5333, partial [Desulfitobacterium hafniense]